MYRYPCHKGIYAGHERGSAGDIINAGCAVSSHPLRSCLGGHMGILAKGGKSRCNNKQKFRGTYGSPRIRGLSGFTRVAAASAVTGKDLTAVGSYVIFGRKSADRSCVGGIIDICGMTAYTTWEREQMKNYLREIFSDILLSIVTKKHGTLTKNTISVRRRLTRSFRNSMTKIHLLWK